MTTTHTHPHAHATKRAAARHVKASAPKSSPRRKTPGRAPTGAELGEVLRKKAPGRLFFVDDAFNKKATAQAHAEKLKRRDIFNVRLVETGLTRPKFAVYIQLKRQFRGRPKRL